ncbi:MAG: hypothetical protein H0T42_00825 [Deltaproteobacteria bacterium]|nr:hypothetical protein [Deltaproteobacteria bacterium]
MTRNTIAVALACTIAAAAPAHADFKEDAKAAAGGLKDKAKAAVDAVVSYKDDADAAAKVAVKIIGIAGDVTAAAGNRVRRSIAFGPHAGTFAGTSFGADTHLVSAVTFGLAFYTFDIPTILDLDKLLQTQLEIAIKAEAAQITAKGGIPDFEEIGRTAYATLKEDIMGKIRPRTFEKPKLGVIVEGIAQLEPGNAMGARAIVSYGIGPIALGLGGGFTRGDSNTIAYAGADISLRLTPWGTSRTPVIDLYLRVDSAFDEGEREYVMTVGGRMLLDLI